MKITKQIEKEIGKEIKNVEKACHLTPKYLRHKWLAIYSFALFMSQLLLGVSYYSGQGLVSENPQIMAKNIISLTNEERIKNELSTLTENDTLDKAAKAKLEDMFQNNYWDHFSPAGRKPWDFINENKYSYNYAGENLAKGFLDSNTTVKAWMESESHKNNLLSSRYKEIGVAVGSGKINGKPTTLVVQMFASPQYGTTPLVAGVKTEILPKSKSITEINPSFTTFASRLPFFIIWLILFSLITFDGIIVRRCGLHTSKRHLFEFRSALLINALVLIVLSINYSAIS